MDVTPVEKLLQRKIGLDPASAGPGLVARAVRARLDALSWKRDELPRYCALLSASDAELQSLIEEVVIPESWFFRDARPFDLMADRLSSALRSDPTRPPARVLCVPCARGEEPYSVALSLLDRGVPGDRFRVLGVDLSRRALAAGRTGVYSGYAFRSADLSFRDRHFTRRDSGYAIHGGVKALVDFVQGNVVDPGFLAGSPPFDAVFCRNLLIYLDEPSRRVVLGHLDRLLTSDGLLFVGHAENLGPLTSQFRPAGDSYCFAFERSRSLPAPAVAPALPVARKVAPARATQPRSVPAEPLRERRGEVTTPPPVNAVSKTLSLDEVAQLADRGRHVEAADACDRLIRAHGPSARAYFLLGVIRQAQGQRPQAEACFEKAVYLDPAHDEALLALSAAARRRGDEAAAANYLRRAGRAAGGGTMP
jgi:chemotaxis protein methyltransferase WspC